MGENGKMCSFYLNKLHFHLADHETWKEGLFPWAFLWDAFRLARRLPDQ